MIDFQKTVIQTYDDNKVRDDKKLAQIFSYNSKRIKELNEKGAAICFTPNPQLNSSDRSTSSTIALQYISLDLDVAKIEQKLSEQEIMEKKTILFNKMGSLAVPPNFVIETKHGYQPIWELAEKIALTTENSRQQINNRYHSLIRGFTAKTGLKSEGDSISRVIRLPGTYHLKNPNNPFLIKITNFNPNKATLEELEKIYVPVKNKVHHTFQCLQFNNNPNIQKIINYPVQEVLRKLSGRKEVDFEQFDFRPNTNGSIQLIINGKVSCQWIDSKNNTIGGAGPGQGNPTIIQFIQWYGINRRGEDEKTAKGKAIGTLMKILEIPDYKLEQTHKNDDVYVNDNDSCKQRVYFEITESKQNIVNELIKCNYQTSPRKVAALLTNFFVEWPSFEDYWLSVAQKYNPRAISRTLNQMIKVQVNGQKTIKNPSAYFTYLIKFRKPRRCI